MTNRALTSLLAVGAVGAVVAVSASGAQLMAPPAELSDAQLLSVRILAAVAVIVGAAGLVVQRLRILTAGRGGADPTVVGVRAAATIMAVVTLVALAFAPPVAVEESEQSRGRGPADRAAFGGSAGSGVGSPSPSFGNESLIRGGDLEGGPEIPIVVRVPQSEEERMLRRLAGIVGLVFLLALVVGAMWRLLHTSSPEEQTPVDADDAEKSLVTSIAEVARHGRDPRSQVTAAYERLLDALAAAGAHREPHEAPLEHLRRVLHPLGVRAEPLQRLAALYIEAQFSERPITDRHRVAAREALAASLADLRAQGGPGRAGLAPSDHVGAIA